MELTTPAFDDGGEIPTEHTCDGADASPALRIANRPQGARALVLIVDDPDAPREEPWVHWLLWNVPPVADEIAGGYPPSGDGKGIEDARQGTNDFGDAAYGGPCPPEGHGQHRYRFTLYALETPLDLDAGANRKALESAMHGLILEQARLTGVYER